MGLRILAQKTLWDYTFWHRIHYGIIYFGIEDIIELYILAQKTLWDYTFWYRRHYGIIHFGTEVIMGLYILHKRHVNIHFWYSVHYSLDLYVYSNRLFGTEGMYGNILFSTEGIAGIATLA